MPADLMESSLTSASTIAGDERSPERHPRKYPISAQEVSLLRALNALSILRRTIRPFNDRLAEAFFSVSIPQVPKKCLGLGGREER